MKRSVALAGACIGAAVLLAAGTVLLRARYYKSYDRVFPGVVCQGVDLSGMTYEEAGDAIEKIVADQRFSVELSFPGGEKGSVLPEQTVLEASPGAALSAAWKCGREDDSLLGPWKRFRSGEITEIPLEFRLQYDREDAESQAERICDAMERGPTDCDGTVDEASHTAEITLGEKGRTLDRETVRGLLEDLAETGNTPVTEPEPEYDEENETTLLHVGSPGYALDVDAAEDMVLDASDRGETAVSVPFDPEYPQDYDLDTFYAWLKRDPQENYYYIDGALVGGTPGYDFDLAEAKTALEAADYGQTVEIPLTVTQPKITREYAEWGLFRDNFGSSDTNHTGDAARNTNLRLACAALNGTVINPGEEFSFNQTVGERTAAKGYQYGIIYSNQGNESQIGGGICQVATGCYQAALMAGMEITERHEHMYTVSYCRGGLDATVYWGSLDVKFRNPWTMPVRLNAWMSGGQVHVSLDGTNFYHYYVKLSSEYLGGLSYRAYRTIYRPDGSVYYREDLGVSSYSSH